ncbi:hypothetical protein [Synechocystis sp. PCC 7509]|uniref:hypothetical protein n=1 Tax=Synechocystis sp. PCC 7509 TaxID=927677 RepID=UPI0002AB9BD4|nr:hypothetical protein [Synechocystis sp. PCC 7509]
MLQPEEIAKIHSYLISGANHLCNSDRSNRTICLGGRNFQLDIWHKMGIISEPTNEALAIAMREASVEPEKHICA